MYDPSHQFQQHLKDQREKGGYEQWRRGQGGPPKGNPIENAIAWIVFIGVALLVLMFLTQVFGS